MKEQFYLGKKEYCNLDKFHLDQTTQLNDLVKIFNYSNFPEKIKILNVRPVLINRYLRDYFESSDRKFRVTLDTNLFYYSASSKERLFTKVYNDKRFPEAGTGATNPYTAFNKVKQRSSWNHKSDKWNPADIW